jgi:hypothetical protein
VIPQEDIDEFYRLLERAREYDKRHNEPECELEEKKARLIKLADELGITLEWPEDTQPKRKTRRKNRG